MGAYTWTCNSCGLVMPSGAIHFGDACDRHRLKVSEGKVTGLQAEIAELQCELAEWRSGKRRVFWRVRYSDGHALDCSSRRIAFRLKRVALVMNSARVYRVTVGPAKKKEAG